MYRYSIIFFCCSRYIVYGTGTGTVPLVPNSYKLRKHLRKTRSLLEPTSLAKKKTPPCIVKQSRNNSLTLSIHYVTDNDTDRYLPKH